MCLLATRDALLCLCDVFQSLLYSIKDLCAACEIDLRSPADGVAGVHELLRWLLNARNHRRPHIRRAPLPVRPSERSEGMRHKTSNTLQLEKPPNVPSKIQTGQQQPVSKRVPASES